MPGARLGFLRRLVAGALIEQGAQKLVSQAAVVELVRAARGLGAAGRSGRRRPETCHVGDLDSDAAAVTRVMSRHDNIRRHW